LKTVRSPHQRRLAHRGRPAPQGESLRDPYFDSLRAPTDAGALWVAHTSRVLANASPRSRTFPGALLTYQNGSQRKIVSARRRNQHARRMRYPNLSASPRKAHTHNTPASLKLKYPGFPSDGAPMMIWSSNLICRSSAASARRLVRLWSVWLGDASPDG